MKNKNDNAGYVKLGLNILISFIIMYSVMFFNVDSADHIYLSLTRLYMSLLMVMPMAVLMILLMKIMFQNKKLNMIIIFASLSVFILAFILLRTQTPVGDVQYMKAMIPHHSSAILTSKNADISDPEVKKLAEEIISSQEREIAEMKALLEKLK